MGDTPLAEVIERVYNGAAPTEDDLRIVDEARAGFHQRSKNREPMTEDDFRVLGLAMLDLRTAAERGVPPTGMVTAARISDAISKEAS